MHLPLVILAALVLVSQPAFAAGAPGEWSLDDEFGASTTRGLATHVFISDGVTQVWSADAAVAMVDYSDANWSWSLRLAHAWVGTFRVAIGVQDADGFTPLGAGAVTEATACKPLLDLSMVCEGVVHMYAPLIIAPRERLAFAIANSPDSGPEAAKTLDVQIGAPESRFAPPVNAPAYPTPELSTILLSGAGLAVVGLVVASRRR